MSIEENKAMIRRYMEEVHNKGNLDALDDFYAVDFDDHTPWPGTPPGLEGMRQTYNVIHSAFTNIHVAIDDMIAEGDKIVLRFSATGTHVGEFMGIPATGKNFTIMEIRIYRIDNGKIVEHWGLLDQTSMMQQLGAISS